MRRGKIPVKWFDAENRRVFVESLRRHERDRSEPPDVSIVKRSAVGQIEAKRGVTKLSLVEVSAGIDQERACESWLDDDSISAGEVEHDELRSSPRAIDRRSGDALPQCASRNLAKHVGLRDRDGGDARSGDLTIEIARDRLGLR